MSDKELIYWREADWHTRDQERIVEMLAVACERMGWRFLQLSGGDPATVAMLRQASHAVIWNGTSPLAAFMLGTRRRLSMPTLVVEQGWLPQRDHFGLDYSGVGGASSLCDDDLSWVSASEYGLLEDLRRQYAPDHDFDPPKAHRSRTLVVGQVMTDTQVVGFTQYQTFNDFAADAIDQIGADRVTIRPHPLTAGYEDLLELCKKRDIEISDPREEKFIHALAKHGSVYGITSTALLEAAFLEVPAAACGECPLLHHQESLDEVEELLAALASRQVPKECEDIIPYLDAMNEFNLYAAGN